MSLCVLFCQQNSLRDAIFASIFTDVESQTLTLTEANEVCSSLDISLDSFNLLDESLMCLWRNFGWPAPPGNIHHGSKFCPFVENSLHPGLQESKSHRIG